MPPVLQPRARAHDKLRGQGAPGRAAAPSPLSRSHAGVWFGQTDCPVSTVAARLSPSLAFWNSTLRVSIFPAPTRGQF